MAGRLYTGPSVPATYDPLWQMFTNLTPSQIAAFQAFPADLTKYLKLRRWHKEIGTVPGATAPIIVGGVPLNTDLQTQQKIAAVKQALDNGTLTGTVEFFAADGNTYTLAGPQITGAYQAMVAFVQATYTAASTLKAGVDNGTVTTRAQIDAAYAAIPMSF